MIKEMFVMKKMIAQICALMLLANSALAAGPNWAWASGSQTNNGSITVKPLAGGTAYSAVQNPTGAVAKTNQNAVTQPPVIIQATAALPLVAIGSACVSGTDTAAVSSSDKRTLLTCGASNTWLITSRVSLPVAIAGNPCNTTVDGDAAVDSTGLLLTCQSGIWKKAGSSGKTLSSQIPGQYCPSTTVSITSSHSGPAYYVIDGSCTITQYWYKSSGGGSWVAGISCSISSGVCIAAGAYKLAIYPTALIETTIGSGSTDVYPWQN